MDYLEDELQDLLGYAEWWDRDAADETPATVDEDGVIHIGDDEA
jgi:hypothetical protein